MSVCSLSRIILICRDADRLAEFYAQAFGFAGLNDSVRADPDFCTLIGLANGHARMRTLQLGDQRLALAQVTPSGQPYPDAVPGYDPLFQHFAISVSDMATAFDALRTVAGWTAISTNGPQILPASSGGVTAFKFRDPEGHPLELLEFPSGAAPSNRSVRIGNPCWGIDHSAISVADTARSVAFYDRLGLARVGGSLNCGPEQQMLDGIPDAVVEVTALAPPAHQVPHVELLCYRGDFARRNVLANPADAAATQLVFTVTGEAFEVLVASIRGAITNTALASQGLSRALLRDPDGHLLCLEAPLDGGS
jgi:catechol 2,3-dioxygenase-like lactoylglutathione lyase family enzyme